jgi:hypothetical protein
MVAHLALLVVLAAAKGGSKPKTIRLPHGPVYKVTVSLASAPNERLIRVERRGGDPADKYQKDSAGALKW